MKTQEILKKLKILGNKKDREGMSRFGINTKKAYGVSIYKLRPFAKEIGKDHKLALELWGTGIHEAQLLAGMIDNPDEVTEKQMESWVKDMNSWDIVDQTCSNLFDKTKYAWSKPYEWVKREEEYVRRTGFVLMTCLSVHDKKAVDKEFEKFLPIIKKYSTDERNFVKKAVNWALRQIGKRNLALNKKAIGMGNEIEKIDSKSARWIAKDALRELTSSKVKERLKKKEKKK